MLLDSRLHYCIEKEYKLKLTDFRRTWLGTSGTRLTETEAMAEVTYLRGSGFRHSEGFSEVRIDSVVGLALSLGRFDPLDESSGPLERDHTTALSLHRPTVQCSVITVWEFRTNTLVKAGATEMDTPTCTWELCLTICIYTQKRVVSY